MRKLTNEEIQRRVKYSTLEQKYLVFAEDGSTVIGRSLLKETAVQHLLAYHAARAALARKGKVSDNVFRSGIKGDIPLENGRMTGAQRKAFDETDGARTVADFTDEKVIQINRRKKH